MTEIDYSSIFQSAPFGFGLHKLLYNENNLPYDFEVVAVNDSYESITGLKSVEVLGKKVTDLLPAIKTEDFDWLSAAAKVVDTGEPLEVIEFVASFGKWLRVKMYRPYEHHFVIAFTDASELTLEKHLNYEITKNLAENEQKFRLIAENTSDGILILSKDGKAEYVSPRLLKMMGRDLDYRHNFSQEAVIEFIHPDDRKYVFETLNEAVRNHQKELILEFRVKHGSGHYLWREDSYSFIYDSNGIYQKSYIICRDISIRKQALLALEKERKLFNSGPVLIIDWRVEENWPIEYITENCLEILGYTAEELQSPDFIFANHVHPDDLQKALDTIEMHIRNRSKSSEQIYRFKVKNGEYRWFFEKSNNEFDSAGNLISSRGYLIDQTEKIEFELESKRKSEKLEIFIEGTNAGIWDWNIESNEAYFSEKWADLIGYDLSEINPQNYEKFSTLVHPDDLPMLEEQLQEYIRQNSKFLNVVFRMKHKSGHWIWINSIGTILEKNVHGYPKLMTGIHLDISKRMTDKERIALNEKRLQKVFDSLVDVYYETNLDGTIIEISPSVSELLGWTREEMVGRSTLEFYRYPEHRKNLLGDLVSDKKHFGFETELVRKDGTTLFVSINAKLDDSDNSREAHYTGTIRDISHTKEISDKLANAVETERALFNANPDLMFLISSDYRIVEYRASDLTNLMLHPDDFLNKPIDDFFPEGLVDKVKEKVDKIITSRCPDSLNYHLEIRGETKHFEGRYMPFGADKVLIIVRDITRLKSAEVRAEILSTAVEQSPVAVIITDIDGNIQYVNPAFTKMTGFAEDEIIGQNPRVLRNTEGHNTDYESMWQTLLSGNIWRGEFYNRTKDGRHYWESASITPMLGQNGEIIHFIGIKQDITNQKNAELAKKYQLELRELLIEIASSYINLPLDNIGNEISRSLERLGRFIDADRAYIFEFDWDKYVCVNTHEWCNEGIKAQIDDLQNIPISDFEEFLPELLNGKESFVYDTNEIKNDNLRSLIQDGEIRSLLSVPIMNQNVCLGILGLDFVRKRHEFHDIEWELLKVYSNILSSIKLRSKNEEKLNEALRLAEQSDKLKSAFLRNISHEVRTPLNGIIGFSKLIGLPDNSPEEIEEYIQLISDSGYRLIDTINNVLDISMIENGLMPVNDTLFSLNTIIYDLHEFYIRQAASRHNEFTIDLGLPDDDSYIVSDPGKLRQILKNFITNAVKFTKNGKITFSYKVEGLELVFKVQDTGIGISEEHHDKIFERFWQADTSMSREFEGSGLGLSICRELSELLGGRIWFESDVNVGSTFYFAINYRKQY